MLIRTLLLLIASFVFACPVANATLAGTTYDEPARLMRDLAISKYMDCHENERFPTFNNHLLYSGYFNMPSARMGVEGEIGLGYAWVHPYHIWSVKAQILPILEASANYRVFSGVEDPVLSRHGFGDFSDKGANLKLALFRPEDSKYRLPGLAVGFEDFLGTQSFKAGYVALTQVLPHCNLEVTLGAGWDRFRTWFGGVSWMPFRNCRLPRFVHGLALVAEYDAIPYEDEHIEPHPKGRKTNSPINFGIKYRLLDHIDLSLSYLRGRELAGQISAQYNFGNTCGFVTKTDNPLPYCSPENSEPIGFLRSEEVLAQDLLYAFRQQWFDLLEVWLSYTSCGEKILRLRITNNAFRTEPEVRCRLNHLLARLVPEDIAFVIVALEAEGFPLQEYHFTTSFLRDWAANWTGGYELKALSTLSEYTSPDPWGERLLFKQHRNVFNMELLPKVDTFFGSATGKFKYAAGLTLGVNGFLFSSVYYNVLFGYTLFNDLHNVGDVDRLNPSQLINVRTDMVRYLKHMGLSVDEMYLQKSWNMGCGWFSRFSLGYFEQMYGGVAAEVLYYPVHSRLAFGLEGAVVKKRNTTGLGFTNKIRKLKGFVPTYQKFLGTQVFADAYYDFKEINLDFKIKAGKFLANDWGARFEVSRYFCSGLRLTFWYTRTNGGDSVNGQPYYDKGIGFSMPLDIFYTHSSRERFGDAMSAWLRDVGASAATGIELYTLIHENRDDHF